jgi:hypothetical protein
MRTSAQQVRATSAQRRARLELAGLQERMCDVALIIEDRDLAEQVIRLAGMVVGIHDLHAVDRHKRCLLCRPAGRRWLVRRRQPCTVLELFQAYRLAIPPSSAGAS